MDPIELTIFGHPEPGGSKTGIPMKRGNNYVHDHKGRPVVQIVDANPRAKTWKRTVAKSIVEQYTGPLLDAPLIVTMDFYLHRWKFHFGTGANSRLLKDSAPLFPLGDHPDALKLARPVEDALTGLVWTDDAITVDLLSRKRYVPGYCVKIGKGKYMPGERVVIRILQHEYLTVGEKAAAAQGQLIPA